MTEGVREHCTRLAEPCLLKLSRSTADGVEGRWGRVDKVDEPGGGLGTSLWNHHCLLVVVAVRVV